MTFQACFQAMGTRMQCVIPHIEPHNGEQVMRLIEDKVHQIELALSLYDQESALCRLNENLRTHKEVVFESAYLSSALHLAEAGSKFTFGFYNAACGAVIQKIKQGQPGSLGDTAFSMIDDTTIRVAEKGVQFDFGGLAKGIAVDEAVLILQQQGIDSAFISFGDSSIYGLGQHPHGEYWPVSIPEPIVGASSLAQANLRNHGLTISSTIANGKNHGETLHHLVNPFTAKAVTTPLTSLVESKSMAWGEMFSTASLISNLELATQDVPADAGISRINIFEHQYQDDNFDFHH